MAANPITEEQSQLFAQESIEADWPKMEDDPGVYESFLKGAIVNLCKKHHIMTRETQNFISAQSILDAHDTGAFGDTRWTFDRAATLIEWRLRRTAGDTAPMPTASKSKPKPTPQASKEPAAQPAPQNEKPISKQELWNHTLKAIGEHYGIDPHKAGQQVVHCFPNGGMNAMIPAVLATKEAIDGYLAAVWRKEANTEAATQTEQAKPTQSQPKPEPARPTTEQATPPDQPDEPSQAEDAAAPYDPAMEPEEPKHGLDIVDALKDFTTLTGKPINEIPYWANRRYEKRYYKAIKIAAGPATDIDPYAVRDRIDKIFGPMGIGWKIVPDPTCGSVEVRQIEGGSYAQWWEVTLVAHIFCYRIVAPDGTMEWQQCSAIGDSDTNKDKGYAFRGAFSSLLKHVLRGFGGFNHLKNRP